MDIRETPICIKKNSYNDHLCAKPSWNGTAWICQEHEDIRREIDWEIKNERNAEYYASDYGEA